MAKYVLKISTDTDKLSERSEEINVLQRRGEAQSIVSDLKDTLKDNVDVVALAAPQLGHDDRIFCIKFSDGEIRTFVNPMITKTEGMHLARETSPSLPGRTFITPRHDRILAKYQKPNGYVEENKFEGVVAEVFEQMVNLLDGILLSDIGLEIDEDFDNAPEEIQTQIIEMWIDSLKKRNEELQKEIQDDPDLKRIDDAIKFMAGVASGEITLEKPEETKEDKK